MTSIWMDISTAPRDGRTVRVKRVFEGEVVYDGPAAWRAVQFGALKDPMTGDAFAQAYEAIGWMDPKQSARVPEPTHWTDEEMAA